MGRSLSGGRGWWGRRTGALVGALLCLVLSACQVTTRVAITTNRGGSGVVAVTVSLDPAALAAVGGLGQLQAADLRQAGWSVGAPRPLPGGGASVTASKPFAAPGQLAPIMASLAGSGPDSTRPFRLTMVRHHSLWSSHTALRGTIDLRCGTGCFGDSGLQAQTGSPIGVNPGQITAQTGATAAQGLAFTLAVTEPGHVESTDATVRHGGQLEWTPTLGRTTEIGVTTTSWNTSTIVITLVAAGLLMVVLVTTVWLWWGRRRRRQRRRRRAARSAPERAAVGSPG